MKRKWPTWTEVCRRGWEKQLAPYSRDYVRDGYCRWCGNKIKGKRKRFCSDSCSKKFAIATVWGRGCGPYKYHIMVRDNFTCQDCGEFLALQNEYGITVPINGKRADIHHIVPLNNGGGDEPSNLITLCEECHKKRHRDIREKEKNKR